VTALGRLRADPGLAIGALVGDAASARRLERKFLRDVGVPPKRLARMFRLQLAVRLWLAGEAGNRSDLAASAGYSDQSHMVHEFRALAGVPPRRALERERAMSDSYKTGTR
jgi:AraC-like DNA-binding protein